MFLHCISLHFALVWHSVAATRINNPPPSDVWGMTKTNFIVAFYVTISHITLCFEQSFLCSQSPWAKGYFYREGGEKKGKNAPFYLAVKKTSCWVLMDFTSAIPADPGATARSWARLGSSRLWALLMKPFSEMERCCNGNTPLHCRIF